MFKFIFVFLLASFSAHSATFKIGVLAPEGTNWAKHMKAMAAKISAQTKKKVRFRFYFGGSQGDERDVLRKMRAGALHGGVFTGKTLGDIDGNLRVVEIPFTFAADRARAWNSVSKLAPYFNQKLAAAKFHNLGFFEIGMVYFVAQKKTPTLESLKGLKIWAWEGDPIVSTMIESLNLVSVPLGLPDVLSSLSTGIIEAAYAPPMGLIALQWSSKVKYLLNLPLAYSMGAFLLSDKSWKRISPAHRELVGRLSAQALAKVSEANTGDNVAALESIRRAGVEFVEFSPEDKAKLPTMRKNIVGRLRGKTFSPDALARLEKTL